MRFGKNMLAATAAVALAALPVAAQAAEAKAKPVASKVKRVGTAKNQESKQLGSNALLIGAAIVAVIIGIIVLSDDDDPDSP